MEVNNNAAVFVAYMSVEEARAQFTYSPLLLEATAPV